MRKTKFTLWLEELRELREKLNDARALSDVNETISINGKLVTINLGKTELSAEVSGNGHPYAPRYLRPLYTENKEAFDDLLESLKQATDTVVTATDTILTAISEGAVPGAVIARMKGEQVSGDSPDLVLGMAQNILKELGNLLKEHIPLLKTFREFSAELGLVAERAMGLQFTTSGQVYFRWGRISGDTYGSANVPEVEEAMFFLANYELIKSRLLRFLEQMEAIRV